MDPTFAFQAVIFDLDGTLVDSAPGILMSFENVLKRAGIKPLIPLNESLIGPPLRQTMAILTGVTLCKDLDVLVEHFKESYDSIGYKATRAYDGINSLLSCLQDKQITMAIATNKRMVPTLKILKFLGWEHYFREVGALDSVTPPYKNKASLISALLDKIAVAAASSVYIGDKREDGEAADANQMPFIAVGWGFGKWRAEPLKSGWSHVTSAVEAMEMLIDV